MKACACRNNELSNDLSTFAPRLLRILAMKYPEYKQLNMPSIEAEIQKTWKENNLFEASVSQREGAAPFVFYEGPPSANGMPGIHHVISRTLKDLVCRYKTMQGFQVKRKAGGDTHGLPVELGVEKELGITKEDIGKKISVAEYNQKCREAVMRYKDKWDELTEKMGYWVNLDDPYITFDNKYIETLWWALKELYKKDYLYKSVSIQPYSPAAGTGLSSHEVNQPGTYKEVKDTTIVAMFAAKRDEKSCFLFDLLPDQEEKIYFMAWTTTPWTLPSNLGLTVGPNIDYVLVKTINPYTHEVCNVVLAQKLLGKYFKTEQENADFAAYANDGKNIPYTLLGSFKGAQLEGCRYEQLLPYEANTPQLSGGDPFRIITGDFVTTEDGTGIVHTAPAFGADDYKVGKANNIGFLVMVDKEGRFVEGLGELSGRYVKNYKDEDNYKEVDVDIAISLKTKGQAFKVEKYAHTYPHCWRTDKPILYYPLDAWFIRTTAVKDRMIELNKTINWKPKATGEGRFGNWLENMVDWNLSRSRYWGTPLPVWVSEESGEMKCIGSVEELNNEIKYANEKLGLQQIITTENLDLHKPFVDGIILADSSGNPMRREPDLIDVWFDSGAMPYAQWHYPFENQANVDANKAFPADFIAEGVDQTRGWFYTLHALGVMLFDSVAYKTVIANGLVLDKNGNKMSKRVGNVVDPFETIAHFSADATRWYLITNASPWDSLKFDLEGIKEVQRKYFGTLYNTYQFFALYANVDKFTFSEAYIPVAERPEIDRWILSSLQTLIKKCSAYLDDYEPTQAGRAMEQFLDEQLSNWYVRLCRRRFWKGEYEYDKICAYQTLYECLEQLSLLMAPISPFFADWMFNNLNQITGRNNSKSAHLAQYPIADESYIDTDLEERMELAQITSSLVLSIRKKVNIKVRQPLQKLMIPVLDDKIETQLKRVEELIKNEVNVKDIDYIRDTEGVIKKKAKANFKTLGAKLGGKMKAAAAIINNLDQHQIGTMEKERSLTIIVDGDPVQLAPEDMEIIAEDIPGWSVANKDTLTVALDITITEDLQDEGNARELVNRIQKIRKDAGFDLTDRINVVIEKNEQLNASIIKFYSYICAEIQAENIEFTDNISSGVEIEINETPITIQVLKTSK
ncbi:MAG: isoleucine--tRNA ligase [Chitinophagaceae bacterium]|nr:isoleucine--tRNA ligase [Chitinophagaceae bacterium]